LDEGCFRIRKRIIVKNCGVLDHKSNVIKYSELFIIINHMTENKKEFKKEDCDRNMEIVILKFENRLMSSVNKFAEKVEGKFAKKKDLSDLKEIVDNMVKINEKRQYEWLKYAITTAISIIVSSIIIKSNN